MILFFALFFLFGLLILSVFVSSMEVYQKANKEICVSKTFKTLSKSFFIKSVWHKIIFLVGFTKQLLLILYVATALLVLKNFYPTYAILAIIFIYLFLHFSIRAISGFFSKKILIFISFLAAIYIYLFYPISNLMFLLTKLAHNFSDLFFTSSYEVDLKNVMDPKILSSLLTFKEKVAREIMVPRINIFSLPSDTSVRDASKKILEKGYSRIPIYKDKPENIIGVLMYKDILKPYVQIDKSSLDQSIDALIKPVLYIPENKKISLLFQEFKAKKRHLAIVVNEYGEMEGIVTIEDVLEELVGDIQDEYDIEEEKNITQMPNGTWIVDAQISIIDLEAKLNVKIPHSTEYETLGGFIFHRAGMIPKKGWSLLLDELEIEVLSSNERSIEKVKITLVDSKTEKKS